MTLNNSPRKSQNQTKSNALLRLNSGSGFIAYLLASSLWLAGVTLASFLGSWLLVDRVGATPEQTGWASTISRVLPILFLLLGGVMIDRSNNRSYLVIMHLLVILPGVALIVLLNLNEQPLSYAAVVGFMAAMAAIQALCNPARQAALTRVAATDIQRSVTLLALLGSVVAFAAVGLGGAIDRIGDTRVLLIMCGLFALSLWPVLMLPSLPTQSSAGASRTTAQEIFAGARAIWGNHILRAVITCNFASSTFNAGAYTVAIPFIAKTVYTGGAQTFATALGAITLGAGLSSVLLLGLMPFVHPGRIFLLFQLTRAAILLALWINFGQWTFYALMALWGVNMGVTSTLARSLVQTEAIDADRGKIFSLMLLSFILASAIGAPILGAIVGSAGPLTALLPGVFMSLLIFGYGARTELWSYVDPQSRPDADASI